MKMKNYLFMFLVGGLSVANLWGLSIAPSNHNQIIDAHPPVYIKKGVNTEGFNFELSNAYIPGPGYINIISQRMKVPGVELLGFTNPDTLLIIKYDDNVITQLSLTGPLNLQVEKTQSHPSFTVNVKVRDDYLIKYKIDTSSYFDALKDIPAPKVYEVELNVNGE